MANRTERKVLWHPRWGKDKFIVSGGSQISLFDWRPDVREFILVSSLADLQLMKCLAWSPDPSFDDLVAVGASTGKVDLWRLEANRQARNNLVHSGPELTLPIGYSRSALALSFSSAEPNLLALGLDKVRQDCSLIVWDINAAPSGKLSSQVRCPARVRQYAYAEVVSSATFLPESPDLLVASVSNLWLRLFDLRDSRKHIAQVPAAKVNDIVTDPFDKNRVVSFSDSSVNIWDCRNLVLPLLTFSLRDASADGARHSSSDPFINAEFSPVRRGWLATLTRDANHVRFWDIQRTSSSEVSFAPETGPQAPVREASRSSKLSRLSWATSSTILPWTASNEPPRTRSAGPSVNVDNIVLSNTRRTKSFQRSIAFFALAPSHYEYPLASNIVVINKDGDIEIHEVYDAPKHPVWSTRGDLALGVGTHFRVFWSPQGDDPIPEPWELECMIAASGEVPNNERKSGADNWSQTQSGNPDRSASQQAKRLERRTYSPASIRRYAPEATDTLGSQGGRSISRNEISSTERISRIENTSLVRQNVEKSQIVGRNLSTSKGRSQLPNSAAALVVGKDISLVMRQRVLRGYGLFSPGHNSKCANGQLASDSRLVGLWSWIDHSSHLLSSGSSKIHGFDFSYQGILGIWMGLEANTPRDVVSLLDGLDLASPSEASPITVLNSPILDGGPSLRSHLASRHAHRTGDGFHGNYTAALNMLNSRTLLDKSAWKPTVHTDKTQQRKLALALCDWKVGEDEFLRWEKEGKYSQLACWLLFMNQGAKAIEVLLRSKNESHHILSGTIAALLQSGTSTRNHEFRNHCEKLIVKLEDPHQRIMLAYIVYNDWTDILEEESLCLRERLAIALRFLDDKELSSYLRRVAEDCRSKGNVEGLIVTGLTPLGLDLLQNYVDLTGDVQTAALLSSYVYPGRYKDARAESWVETYRDLLDGWKLFHHRCQFDIDRGRILQEVVWNGEFGPMECVKKQFLIRCNFCNKVVNAQQQQRPQEPIAIQRRRAAACPACGRALPRCCVCLMSICVIPDSGRDSDHIQTSFRDTIDDAFVFCQKCRHGGHASHIMSWFFEVDGTGGRRPRTCPVADCDCYCNED